MKAPKNVIPAATAEPVSLDIGAVPAPVVTLAAALRGIRDLQEQSTPGPLSTGDWNLRQAARNCLDVREFLRLSGNDDLASAVRRAAVLDPKATAEFLALRFDDEGKEIQ